MEKSGAGEAVSGGPQDEPFRECCCLSGGVGATEKFVQHSDMYMCLFPEGHSRKWIQNQEAGQDTLTVCSQVLAVNMKNSKKS